MSETSSSGESASNQADERSQDDTAGPSNDSMPSQETRPSEMDTMDAPDQMGESSSDFPRGFIHRRGRSIYLDDQPFRFKGISFGNEVWTNDEVPYLHHTEEDFRRIAEWGMNSVRFYINYATLEDDSNPMVYKDTGWEWLDQNVSWAKAHGIYLILNVHVPQGGFQPGPDGNALWDDPQNQERFIALWTAIAERYSDEPTIAGYDLLNEPDVSTSKSQWESLAQQTVDAIRAVDENHLLIVERTNAVNQDYTLDAQMNLFLVDDDNVMYTFHFYGPFPYTHQFADWVDLGDGGRYPDTSVQESLDRGGAKHPRTREYIEHALGQYLNFGRNNDVPLYLGEFGAIRYCFENGKGGDEYVRDVLAVAAENDLSFSYHTYHEDNFGVFYGYGQAVDPGNSNSALLDVLSSAQ